jgi:hypothetical protein
MKPMFPIFSILIALLLCFCAYVSWLNPESLATMRVSAIVWTGSIGWLILGLWLMFYKGE